jgi:hypothetical protein
MNKTKTQHNWTAFIKLFGEQHRGRATRIGVFVGEPGSLTDYWLADGLPLEGIAIETRGDAATIEIMLGSAAGRGDRAFTHQIEKARSVQINLSASGEADGLEIENDRGAVTFLRFENDA